MSTKFPVLRYVHSGKKKRIVLIALLLTSRVEPVQFPKVYQCSKYTKAEGVVHCGCTVQLGWREEKEFKFPILLYHI